jgi:hypothetical protein
VEAGIDSQPVFGFLGASDDADRQVTNRRMLAMP